LGRIGLLSPPFLKGDLGGCDEGEIPPPYLLMTS
jgi:hypothetical protein